MSPCCELQRTAESLLPHTTHPNSNRQNSAQLFAVHWQTWTHRDSIPDEQGMSHSTLPLPAESARFDPAPVAASEAEVVMKGDLVVGGESHAHDLVGSAIHVPQGTHLVVDQCHTGMLFVLQGPTRVELPSVFNPVVPLTFEFCAGTANAKHPFGNMSFGCTNGHEFASSSLVRVSICRNVAQADGAGGAGGADGADGADGATASGACLNYQQHHTFMLFPGSTTAPDAPDVSAADATDATAATDATDDARPLLYIGTRDTFMFARVLWLQLLVQTARAADGRIRLRLTGHVGILCKGATQDCRCQWLSDENHLVHDGKVVEP